jgi:general stress protein 26
LLVSVAEDGSLDSRPMGCLQRRFDGTLWFLVFRNALTLRQLPHNDQVLVSYANSAKSEYVSISGQARMIDDRHKVRELWNEGLRVWFPRGPDDPDLGLLAVDVQAAKYWTPRIGAAGYAWAYVRSLLTGQAPAPDDVADMKKVRF